MNENVKKEDVKLFEMTIYVKESGKIGFEVKADEDENLPDPIKMVGLLETVKMDIHESASNSNKGEVGDLVEVELTEDDFSLPTGGELKKMGLGVGDTVSLPRQIAEARSQMFGKTKLSVVSDSDKEDSKGE